MSVSHKQVSDDQAAHFGVLCGVDRCQGPSDSELCTLMARDPPATHIREHPPEEE